MSKDKAKVKKEWKELPAAQVSDSLLWEATKRYTSYITKNNGLTLSLDPMNLTGLNTKKDSTKKRRKKDPLLDSTLISKLRN